MQLIDLFPTSDALTGAPVVAVANGVLKILHRRFKSGYSEAEIEYNFLLEVRNHFKSFESRMAVAEGWQWLVHEGLLCQHPDKQAGWLTLSRKGWEAASAADLQTWNAGRALPTETLHAVLHGACLTLFRQGLFDTAVFEAFKTLEVRIREDAGLGVEVIGTSSRQRLLTLQADLCLT